MKKLLSILGAAGLVVSTSAVLVSCGGPKEVAPQTPKEKLQGLINQAQAVKDQFEYDGFDKAVEDLNIAISIAQKALSDGEIDGDFIMAQETLEASIRKIEKDVEDLIASYTITISLAEGEKLKYDLLIDGMSNKQADEVWNSMSQNVKDSVTDVSLTSFDKLKQTKAIYENGGFASPNIWTYGLYEQSNENIGDDFRLLVTGAKTENSADALNIDKKYDNADNSINADNAKPGDALFLRIYTCGGEAPSSVGPIGMTFVFKLIIN